MALCLTASQHPYRDSRGTGLYVCECAHCTGFCSCDSNTGPNNPRDAEWRAQEDALLLPGRKPCWR
jgi:hypothetical protein